jgi:hypothetical protein
LKGFRRAFNESHPDPAFVELSTKVILLLLRFHGAFNESHPAFVELSTKVILLSESFQRMSSCLKFLQQAQVKYSQKLQFFTQL